MLNAIARWWRGRTSERLPERSPLDDLRTLGAGGDRPFDPIGSEIATGSTALPLESIHLLAPRLVRESARLSHAEAEAKLRALEAARPGYDRQGESALADLNARLRETAVWCASQADRRALATCLRPAWMAAHVLARDRWQSVHEVASERRRALAELRTTEQVTYRGRFMVYFPDEHVSDGAAQAGSRGFFDVYNTPPWGTWVGHFEDPRADDSARSYVVAWIPADLEDIAAAGINVDPVVSINWLEDSSVEAKYVIDYLLSANRAGG